MSLAALCLAFWWVAAFGVQAWATIAAAAAHGRPAPARAQRRPFTVLLPVSRIDHRFDEAMRAAFLQAGPDVEFILAAEHNDSPALARARAIAMEMGVDVRVFTGRAGLAASPKLDMLYLPLLAARHDVVVIRDSNVLLQPGQLAATVDELEPGVGLVSAVPVVVDVRSFAAEVEAAFVNAFHARFLAAGSAHDVGVGIGKLMAFRRSDLERAGGVDVLLSSIAEDHLVAKAIRSVGLRAVMSRHAAHHPVGVRTLDEVAQRQLRWMLCRRAEETLAFLLEPTCGVVAAAIVAAAGASLFGFSSLAAVVATIVLWYGLEAIHAARLGWPYGPRAFAAFLVREALAPVLWVRAWLTREAVWNGRRVQVSLTQERPAA